MKSSRLRLQDYLRNAGTGDSGGFTTMGTVARKKVSIVTPFYDEEASIQSFAHAVTEMADGCTQVDFEFVCVDDGSKDNTLELLVALSKKDKRFVVIELTRNFGKEPALTAGIDVAT